MAGVAVTMIVGMAVGGMAAVDVGVGKPPFAVTIAAGVAGRMGMRGHEVHCTQES